MDTANGRPASDRDEGIRPAGVSDRGRLWQAVRLAEVRLRLPIVLVVAALVVGRWDALRNRWDRLIRSTPAESIAGQAVSTDTEYFCPMDPGVLSNWPGRCGVCNMALVRRKKGDATLLPEGVVARMQFSPYRVQLAGIRAEVVSFQPLARKWSASGFVARRGELATVEVDVPSRQAPWVAEGSEARVVCSEFPGAAMAGRVRAIARDEGSRRAVVAIAGPPAVLKDGLIATVRFEVPVANFEPFRSMPRNPAAPVPGEARQIYVCADHDDSTALRPGRCPLDQKERMPRRLGEGERVRWWCPMHPAVTAEKPGSSCRECGGMALRPRVITYAPAGQVLAVPQSAVVDTGERQIVYVEEMPGMFDGVEVVLGARCGDFYPVVRGLEPGQRVAIAGAFLLDAETRLNPSLAAAYFGSGAGRAAVEPAGPTPGPAANPTKTEGTLDGLGPEDRALADRQKTCPVTGLALGSMGKPERQVVAGRVVFLCCGGCRSKLLADPAKYLARIP